MLRGRHRGLPVAIDRASECLPLAFAHPRSRLTLLGWRIVLLPADMVPTNNASSYDPRSPPPRLQTVATMTSVPNSPDPNIMRSPTTSPKLEQRIYSREGPQPNMMDLVHATYGTVSPPTLDTRNLDVNNYYQGASNSPSFGPKV